MKPSVKTNSANHLLNCLEPAAFERLARNLTRVTLRPKEIVYRPDEPIDHVFFPENTVLCLMTLMSNGDTIEAATVGREGASWISASVGAQSMPCETLVVIEGTALRLPIAEEQTPYRDRTRGSQSKLRTFRDGFRILRTIFFLVKEERPLQFFSGVAATLFIAAVALGWPLLTEYLRSGLVPRFPTAILAMGLMIMSAVSFVAGLILDTVTVGRREMKRLHYLSLQGPTFRERRRLP